MPQYALRTARFPVNNPALFKLTHYPLPHYEVREFNNRFAVVGFEEGLPECNLNIEVSP